MLCETQDARKAAERDEAADDLDAALASGQP
jgi:hypothetical protein